LSFFRTSLHLKTAIFIAVFEPDSDNTRSGSVRSAPGQSSAHWFGQESSMPVWNIGTVADEPTVSLLQWRILETEDGSRHFVGADERDLTGRVSTAIVLLDRVTLRGETESGRIYQLVGGSGLSSNADYVWHRWCSVNNVKAYADVTQQFVAEVPNDKPA
jgi:hypothetical protein